MKILITGINGYIGSQLKKYFLEKKYKIYGISSKSKKSDYNKLIKKKIKPNAIIHCAGSGLVAINKYSHKIHKNKNYGSTKELLNFIKKSNLKNSNIIFLSSQAVYGKVSTSKISERNYVAPISSYGKTKLLAEKELKKIKNNYVIILRLFSIYGIGLKKQIIWDACKNFKLKKPIFRGTGLEKRDFLNIKDFTRLISIIIKTKNEKYSIYNVGSGSGTLILKLLIKIKKELKNKKKIVFTGKSNKAEKQNFISSNTKVQKYFNWKPKIKMSKEIQKYTNWFKENY